MIYYSQPRREEHGKGSEDVVGFVVEPAVVGGRTINRGLGEGGRELSLRIAEGF